MYACPSVTMTEISVQNATLWAMLLQIRYRKFPAKYWEHMLTEAESGASYPRPVKLEQL